MKSHQPYPNIYQLRIVLRDIRPLICPRGWGELPIPDGPLTVGIDGGYVKAQGMAQGWFEVIAGKSILSFRRGDEQANPSIKCFAFVQTYDQKPKRRLFDVLES